MATLSVQSISEVGAALTYAAAAAGGDAFPNADDRTFLHVKNGGGSSVTVTITAQTTTATVPGLGVMTKANRTVAIPAGDDRLIGPFPQKAFNNSSNQVAVGYSAVTSVSVAVVRVPAQ
ncbi:hypothetical protein [Azospirillum canadense]|uniref:hypothetical protein n=1 Tax=Azospirillum canadense TaxID=403962 RepID=UPI002225CAF2|nr:hypothetical protein [Azospirillum canadense]MCW2242260.1 hypothetical protein [Azospirillum canadense]